MCNDYVDKWEALQKIKELFEKHSDEEYLEFERIPVSERKHRRPDICAFLLLDEKSPSTTGDIVGGADHDVFYIDFDNYPALTENDVIYLLRCGITLYDDSLQSYC